MTLSVSDGTDNGDQGNGPLKRADERDVMQLRAVLRIVRGLDGEDRLGLQRVLARLPGDLRNGALDALREVGEREELKRDDFAALRLLVNGRSAALQGLIRLAVHRRLEELQTDWRSFEFEPEN